MPYGLVGTPSVFLCFKNYMLRECLGQYAIAYIYKILIYSSNRHKHITYVRRVLILKSP